MLASALLPLALAGNHLDANNLVYRSPYTNHDGLALDTHAIAKRHDQTTELLTKRQLSQPAPEGDVGTYTLSGYGLGATDWSNSDRIYAGDVNFSELDVSRCLDDSEPDFLSFVACSSLGGQWRPLRLLCPPLDPSGTDGRGSGRYSGLCDLQGLHRPRWNCKFGLGPSTSRK